MTRGSGTHWLRPHLARAGLCFLATFLSCQVALAEPPVRVSGSSWVHDAATRVALERGYFDGQGPVIKVEIEGSGKASLERLLAGEVEFAKMATTPLARALVDRAGKDPGPQDPVILATTSLSNQTHHVLAVRDRGIDNPRDLAGRRIGMLFDTSAEFFWSLFAPIHGLDPDDVELVDLPLEDMAEALEKGEVDAVVTWDPWVYRQRQAVDRETLTFSERQIYTMNWLLVTRREIVDEHPELADRVIRGYQKAVDTILAEPEQVIEYQSDDPELSSEYLREMREQVIFQLSLNWALLTAMEQQLNWILHREIPGPAMRPKPQDYIAPGPISRVAPEQLMLPEIRRTMDSSDGS